MTGHGHERINVPKLEGLVSFNSGEVIRFLTNWIEGNSHLADSLHDVVYIQVAANRSETGRENEEAN